MAWSIKKFFSFKSKPLSFHYDTLGIEANTIASDCSFTGLKYEITKTVFPFAQISAIKHKDKKSVVSQYFSTFSFRNSIFQFCFDDNRSYQFKSSILTGPFVTKYHSIVSSKKDVYSQLESMYKSLYYNIGVKLISPTFHCSNLIYIFNCCKSIGSVCIGMEIVGIDNQLGLSFSGRVENEKSIFYANLQRFNTITLSFYRRIFKNIELAFETKKSKDFSSIAAGIRLATFKNEIKMSIDHKLRFSFNWDEKLTENLRANFNCEVLNGEFDYGIGFSLDS